MFLICLKRVWSLVAGMNTAIVMLMSGRESQRNELAGLFILINLIILVIIIFINIVIIVISTLFLICIIILLTIITQYY